jgi:hypothetical protein
MITWNKLLGRRGGNPSPAKSTPHSRAGVAQSNPHEIRQSLRRRIATQLTEHPDVCDGLGPDDWPSQTPGDASAPLQADGMSGQKKVRQ